MAKSERKQAVERDVALEKMAAIFKAMGDPTRLRIFEFLRANSGPVALNKKGGVRLLSESADSESDAGITVGEVGLHVTGGAKDPSTISHHLKELRQASLISMERKGKHMICALHPDAMKMLSEFCCADEIKNQGAKKEDAKISAAPTAAEEPIKAAAPRRRRAKETEIQGMTMETLAAPPVAEPEAIPATKTEPEISAPTRKKKRKE